MSISIPRLRTWFALIAIAVVAVVAGFYLYARMTVSRAIREAPQRLGIEIQQSTEGFSLSKSEGGRTLFTVQASKAIQYKQGGRAELRDVNIVVYGRKANRFDQIRGTSFEYDPQTGDVIARGEVHIQLEGNAEGPDRPDQAPPGELKNTIHLKTSGLVFNQKSGIARTEEAIEFRFPQASGSAVGAIYDAKANQLTLSSKIHIVTTGGKPTSVDSGHGVITKEPRQVVLEAVKVTQTDRDLEANRVVVLLNESNAIDHITATGDVRLSGRGRNALLVRAPRADMDLGASNLLTSASFSGGVQFQGSGENRLDGNAGRVALDFVARNQLNRIRASEAVRLRQLPQQGSKAQAVDIAADTLVFNVRNGKRVESAQTGGAAQITLAPQSATAVAGERTVITAGSFRALFDSRNRLTVVRGEPNARIVAMTPGQPDKISTSRTLDVQFAAAGGISSIVQEGDFRYTEPQVANAIASTGPGGRVATAERARYSPTDEMLTLSGSPRVVEGGMTIAAQSMRLNRRSGDAVAQGDVKTTYSELKQDPNGALLATSDPVHATARTMTARKATGVARYSGGARLWQGANIVQAPAIEFDKTNRSVVAEGTTAQPVTSVFVQVDKSGKSTPVVVTAAKLAYVDTQRRARYSGGVLAKGADATITADHVDVVLQASGQQSAAVAGPSQLKEIVAEKGVVIQQAKRRATGDRLVYSTTDGRFVLTGGPPVIVDAERGTVRGDSLTFYSRDDKVVIEGKDASRTVTRTRVSR
ncbi:MAG TPA: LPS export ABC transporter periplasmic protein LptC [Clostridia bacterium]|nr:LPS export ABC transporter periplasmic protein LptC [Clostridia bacterium]